MSGGGGGGGGASIGDRGARVDHSREVATRPATCPGRLGAGGSRSDEAGFSAAPSNPVGGAGAASSCGSTGTFLARLPTEVLCVRRGLSHDQHFRCPAVGSERRRSSPAWRFRRVLGEGSPDFLACSGERSDCRERPGRQVDFEPPDAGQRHNLASQDRRSARAELIGGLKLYCGIDVRSMGSMRHRAEMEGATLDAGSAGSPARAPRLAFRAGAPAAPRRTRKRTCRRCGHCPKHDAGSVRPAVRSKQSPWRARVDLDRTSIYRHLDAVKCRPAYRTYCACHNYTRDRARTLAVRVIETS